MESSSITLYRFNQQNNVRFNKTEVLDLARDGLDILLPQLEQPGDPGPLGAPGHGSGYRPLETLPFGCRQYSAPSKDK